MSDTVIVGLLPWQRLCGVCDYVITRANHYQIQELIAKQTAGEWIFNGEQPAWIDTNVSTRGPDGHWHLPVAL